MDKPAASPEITLGPVTSMAALAERWRALEAASSGGFFRSWTFVSEQAARFSYPQLLAVRAHGEDLGLALLNRARGRLFLNETGDAAQDSVFVEHSGLLVRPGAEAMLPHALRMACAAGPVVLSGVDAAHVAAAGQAGLVVRHATRRDPVIVLDALKGPYLDSLSANARGQIRRAMRLCGPGLGVTRAEGEAAALGYFAALVDLHQAAWRRRGKPGAFADTGILRFHEGLIRRAVPRGEADLLRIAAGTKTVGYLYNFRHGGRVYCYQSGFAAYEDSRIKPGLVSHSLAVEHYRAEGARLYDLLAGGARYKATLAPESLAPNHLSPNPSAAAGAEMLHWATLYARHSLRGRALVARQRALAWMRQRSTRNLPS